MGDLKANFYMYKDFMASFIKYKERIKASDNWMQKFAKLKGLTVNPHKMYLTNIKIALAENEDIYGLRICPCFEATGDKNLDQKLVCPCVFVEQEIAEHGTCHCNLFGKKDLTDKEWGLQVARVMMEYNIPLLKVDETTIDTRNVPIDEKRFIEIPDPVHQLKQALFQLSGSFDMIVEKEQSAKNIVAYCKLKDIDAVYQKDSNFYLVHIYR